MHPAFIHSPERQSQHEWVEVGSGASQQGFGATFLVFAANRAMDGPSPPERPPSDHTLRPTRPSGRGTMSHLKRLSVNGLASSPLDLLQSPIRHASLTDPGGVAVSTQYTAPISVTPCRMGPSLPTAVEATPVTVVKYDAALPRRTRLDHRIVRVCCCSQICCTSRNVPLAV